MLGSVEAFSLFEAGGTPIPNARELLERFSSAGRFAGYREDPRQVEPGERLVVATDRWADLVFGEQGAELGDFDVLLTPEDYPWGYAEFARNLAGWPAVLRGPVGRHEAEPHLSRYGKALVRDGEVVPADKDAVALLQQTAARHTPEIEFVASRLHDEASRRTYARILSGTMDRMFHHYCERVFAAVQYFECVRWEPGMVVLNGGVQEGFEIPYLMALTEGSGTVLCIDPSGFSRLSAFARATLDRFPARLLAYPYAIWSESGSQRLPVAENGAVLSQYKDRNVHALEEVAFECRSIDDLVEEQGLDRVDLIKLDIEGAEPAALQGMSRTLQTFRPQLAISIYHWPEHMWKLPARLMTSLSDYAFFVRHYAYGRWECILYAIPLERCVPAAPA